MFREIAKVKQVPGEPTRRWFADENMDLFVWLEKDDCYTGFQLTYDKPHSEKAITWKSETGFHHTRVDDGFRPGHHPGSPMLIPDGTFEAERVLTAFLQRAQTIDESIVTLVAERLRHYEQDAGKQTTRAGWAAGFGVLSKVLTWVSNRLGGK